MPRLDFLSHQDITHQLVTDAGGQILILILGFSALM